MRYYLVTWTPSTSRGRGTTGAGTANLTADITTFLITGLDQAGAYFLLSVSAGTIAGLGPASVSMVPLSFTGRFTFMFASRDSMGRVIKNSMCIPTGATPVTGVDTGAIIGSIAAFFVAIAAVMIVLRRVHYTTLFCPLTGNEPADIKNVCAGVKDTRSLPMPMSPPQGPVVTFLPWSSLQLR